MSIQSRDIIPLSTARAKLADLIDEVRAGAEKIITRNGESAVALVDPRKLDYYHQLERDQYAIDVAKDVSRGLDDIEAGRVRDLAGFLDAEIERISRSEK